MAGPSVDAVIDGRGHLVRDGHGPTRDPTRLAGGLCKRVGPLMAASLTPVAVSVTRGDEGDLVLFMVREDGVDGSHYRSGAATASATTTAVTDAVLDALGAEHGVLTAMAPRWAATPGVVAVTAVVDIEVTAATGDGDLTDTHLRVMRAMPGPGSLAVGTEDAEHRAIRLSSAALALTATPGAPVLKLVDNWMDHVEGAWHG